MSGIWWDSHAELHDLYHWLSDRDEAPDALAFLAKPWTFGPDRRAMLREREAAQMADNIAALEKSVTAAQLRRAFERGVGK
jgi:hypothetical protein